MQHIYKQIENSFDWKELSLNVENTLKDYIGTGEEETINSNVLKNIQLAMNIAIINIKKRHIICTFNYLVDNEITLSWPENNYKD